MRWLIILAMIFFVPHVYADSPAYDENMVVKTDIIALPAGTVHQGDYFACGDSVEISGEVNGDVYVLANQVVIDGKINGDLLAVGGSIDVSGVITQNVRSIAGQVLISGHVGNNVTVVAGNVQLLGSGTVGNNVVVTAANVDLASKIGSNVSIVASNLRISSSILNRVEAYVGQLRITSRAHIGGGVDYRSSSIAWIDPAAVIGGQTIHHPSLVHELVRGTWIQKILFGGKVVALLMNFLYSLVIGIILIKMFPGNLESAVHALKTHPWKAFSWGLMLLFLLPLASLVLLMTVLGVPFALTLIAANIIGFYTAKIYSIFWISHWFLAKFRLHIHRISVLTFGLIIYFLLASIPILGVIFSFVVMLFGLGAAVLAQAHQLHHGKRT